MQATLLRREIMVLSFHTGEPMPGSREPPDTLYLRLMHMHDEAFAAEQFEVAYHLLAAAVHAAEELSSVESLSQLQDVAVTRQSEIDRMHPAHKISSASASGRGSLPLFTALASIADAIRGRIAADGAVERLRAEAGQVD